MKLSQTPPSVLNDWIKTLTTLNSGSSDRRVELLQEKLQICSFRLLPSWSAGLVQVAIFSTQETKNVQIVERVHSFIRLLKCKRFHVHVSAPAREVLLLSLSLSTVAGTGLPDIMDESNFDECRQERAGRLGDGRVG